MVNSPVLPDRSLALPILLCNALPCNALECPTKRVCALVDTLPAKADKSPVMGQ